MTKNGDIAEFKGTTREAIADLKEDVKCIKNDVASLNKRFWILLILVTVAVIEKLPTLLALAGL